MPVALFEMIAPYIEDVLIAERVRKRGASYEAGGVTRGEFQERLGISDSEVDSAASDLAERSDPISDPSTGRGR